MIDPITQYILEKEDYKKLDVLVNILNEWDPVTDKEMGLTRIIGGEKGQQFLAHIDMNKLINYIDDKVRSANVSGYNQGVTHGGVATLAAATIAALVTTVAYKTYKRFLSKAAKACNKYSGTEKTGCMNKFKRDATKRRIQDLTKGKQACKHTKAPSKCISKIDKKIGKLKASLGEL